MTLSSDPVVLIPDLLAQPNFYSFAAELELAVPEEIHPSAQRAVHEYLQEAKYLAWGPEALRLVEMAAEKIADELRWHAVKLDTGGDHDGAERCLCQAERFDNWLGPKPKGLR